MKTEIIAPSKARQVMLEDCERKIIMQYKKGMEATCAIAKEFTIIEEQELYRDLEYETFEDYIKERLGLEMPGVRKTMAIALASENLRQAGLALPENESQVIELTRVEPEDQAVVWQLVLDAAEKVERRITVNAVRDAVRAYEESARNSAPATTQSTGGTRRGVTTALDLEGDANGAPKKSSPSVKVKPPVYSDQGEAALERIGRLCGEPIAKGIASGNLPLTERELTKWSQQTDQMVKNLAHYISDLRWSVTQALNFEERSLNEATTVGELIMLAKARGGLYKEINERYKLAIQLLAA